MCCAAAGEGCQSYHSVMSCNTKFGMTSSSSSSPPVAEDSPTDTLLRGLRIHERSGDMTPAAALAFSHMEEELVERIPPMLSGGDGDKMSSSCRGGGGGGGQQQRRITRIHSIPSES